MRFKIFYAALLALLFSCVALADSFTFTISASNGMTGSGTLTGTADSYTAGAFVITSATGTFGGQPLSLIPGGDTQNYLYYGMPNGGSYIYDNVLYTTGTPVDYFGLLFSLNGTDPLNIYFDNGAMIGQIGDFTVNQAFNVSFASEQAVTAEPASVLLLLTGAGLMFAFRRRLVVADFGGPWRTAATSR